ncbi:MGMT family protein [Candidatus Dojkabacteria bacterium]|jgi:alkylated DNA nucleotide flippase Atl1|nr:MGMT family protein [Candidatus Dojkabacteria bacterium]
MSINWIEKRDKHKFPPIRKMTEKGMMYISSPKEIDKLVKKIPKGKITTTKEIVRYFTKREKVDFTCPLTTGIFLSIDANAAEQEIEEGKKRSEVTPYWRVVKEKNRLNDKYLGRPSKQAEYLKKEGHQIVNSKVKAFKYELGDNPEYFEF